VIHHRKEFGIGRKEVCIHIPMPLSYWKQYTTSEVKNKIQETIF
jgi:hypothetical protein